MMIWATRCEVVEKMGIEPLTKLIDSPPVGIVELTIVELVIEELDIVELVIVEFVIVEFVIVELVNVPFDAVMLPPNSV